MYKILLSILSLAFLTGFSEPTELNGFWYACDQENCTLDSAVALYEFSDTTVSLYLKMPDGLDPVKIFEGIYFIEKDSFCSLNNNGDTSRAGLHFINDSTVHMVVGLEQKTILKKM